MSSRTLSLVAALGVIAILVSSFSIYFTFDGLQSQRSLLESNEFLLKDTQNQIDRLQTAIDGVRDDMQAIEAVASDLDGQVSKLAESDAGITERLRTLNQTTSDGLVDLKERLESQGAAFARNLTRTEENLQGSVAEIRSDLDAIESEVETLDSNLSKLTEDVSNIGGRVESQREQTPIEVYESSYRSVVVIRTPSGQGSGFLYNGSNLIATNWHVVEGETDIEVQFYDRSRSTATIVGIDAYSDVAVIRVEDAPADSKPLSLGNSSGLYVGQQVVAIGNPLGLTGSLSAGYVSQINRQIDVGGVPIIVPVLQLDVTIAPGSSGGPLFDLSGNVVGITNAGTDQGFNFAVPSNIVKRVAASLITRGFYSHPYFGFSAVDLTPETITSLNVLNVEPTQTGLLVTEVVQNLPAASAGLTAAVSATAPDGSPGLLARDIIVAIDDQHLLDFSDWWAYIAEHVSPGEPVTLTLWRSGETVSIQVIPTVRPQYQG